MDRLSNERRDLHKFQSAAGTSLRCVRPFDGNATTYAIIRFRRRRRVGVVTGRPTAVRPTGRMDVPLRRVMKIHLSHSFAVSVGGWSWSKGALGGRLGRRRQRIRAFRYAHRPTSPARSILAKQRSRKEAAFIASVLCSATLLLIGLYRAYTLSQKNVPLYFYDNFGKY